VSGDSTSQRDPALETFVEAIEGALGTRRGTDHALSPREFAIARGWYEAGVSLATVLVGIDLAFEADSSISSLAFCRRRVEQLAAGATRGAPRPTGHESARPSLPELAERLDALRGRLQELPPRAAALPLQEVEAVSDLVAVAARPNWDYLGERLEGIDDLVSAAAIEALPPHEMEELRGEARRAGERHRGRVDPGSLEEAMERFVRQRARERLQLPRVSTV
jgi:hypothetical protein